MAAERPVVAGLSGLCVEHDLGPGLACGAPEEQHQRLANVAEVVVGLDLGLGVQRHGPEELKK